MKSLHAITIAGIQRELAKVKRVLEEYKDKEKKMYAKMFAWLDSNLIYTYILIAAVVQMY